MIGFPPIKHTPIPPPTEKEIKRLEQEAQREKEGKKEAQKYTVIWR